MEVVKGHFENLMKTIYLYTHIHTHAFKRFMETQTLIQILFQMILG